MKIHYWKLKPTYLRAIKSDFKRKWRKHLKPYKKYLNDPLTLTALAITLGILFVLAQKVWAKPELIEVGIERPTREQMKPLKQSKTETVQLATVKVIEPQKPPNYASGDSVWDRLAECESGGNWSINSGNGFYGGLQFDLSTWQSNGGSGYPHENSREEQIRVAKVLYSNRGASPWPHCGQYM